MYSDRGAVSGVGCLPHTSWVRTHGKHVTGGLTTWPRRSKISKTARCCWWLVHCTRSTAPEWFILPNVIALWGGMQDKLFHVVQSKHACLATSSLSTSTPIRPTLCRQLYYTPSWPTPRSPFTCFKLSSGSWNRSIFLWAKNSSMRQRKVDCYHGILLVKYLVTGYW
jgi:hypothetical protein